MDKKVVFFDIDGTLLDHEKNIPLSTRQAIKELKNNGVYVVIATGRPPFMFERVREQLGIESFISYTGQYVVFEGKIIYKNPFKEAELKTLYKESVLNNYPMILMGETEMRATVGNHPHVIDGLASLKFKYPEVDLGFHHDTSIYQALLFQERDEKKAFKDKHTGFHFIHWGEFACDVLPKGGSKAIGVNKILDASGLKKVNSFAFGDGLNDLEMIQEVGTGIAMGNANPKLKNVADYTTDDVDKDGVIKGLQKYNLL